MTDVAYVDDQGWIIDNLFELVSIILSEILAGTDAQPSVANESTDTSVEAGPNLSVADGVRGQTSEREISGLAGIKIDE